jgi:DNA-binding NtrC family response regulator
MPDGKHMGRGGIGIVEHPTEDAEVTTTINGTPSSRKDKEHLPLQLVALESTGLAIFPLPDSGLINIGRGEDCQVRINDALVSRRHAVLHVNPLSIEDAGSANGTKIGTLKLAPGAAAALQPGQAISVGRSLLIVRRAASAGGAEPRDPCGQALSVRDEGVVVSDPSMKKLYAVVDRLAQAPINVLILGETGVGKEVVAEAIHRASPRKDSPLLRLNCASLPEALLESELFGHERGAFTGACATKPGLIELADRGTVFLDEVGELAASLQVKLLRFIETRETMRIGGTRARQVDVRFVFATNRDLEAEVRAGRFRSDLFFRLKGAVVYVPPLRERIAEILPLAETYLRRAAAQMRLEKCPTLSDEARARLRTHSWPGNVRELRNVIERAVILCDSALIDAADLELDFAKAPVERSASATTATDASFLSGSERDRIAQALREHGGNQSRAAESLGIPRRTFVRKLAELGFPRPRRAE